MATARPFHRPKYSAEVEARMKEIREKQKRERDAR